MQRNLLFFLITFLASLSSLQAVNPKKNCHCNANKERTLSIIKPDAVQDGHIGDILSRFEKANLRIIATKIRHLSKEEAETFYATHKGKPFFEGLISFMTSGPIVINVLEGENAIKKNRELIGTTDSRKSLSGTIRADFGKDNRRNAVHGSDTEENAKKEIDFFFANIDLK